MINAQGERITERSTQDLLSRVYRFGPASITALIILARVAYSPWLTHPDESLIVQVIYLCWEAAAIWHVSLVVTERYKREMVVYAIINLPLMYVITLFCIMSVNGAYP